MRGEDEEGGSQKELQRGVFSGAPGVCLDGTGTLLVWFPNTDVLKGEQNINNENLVRTHEACQTLFFSL